MTFIKNHLLLTLLFSSRVVFSQWASQFSGTTNLLVTVNFATPDTGYACDESLNVWHTTDGGQNWNSFPAVQAWGTYFISKNVGFAHGVDLKKTNDGGNTWNDVFNYSVSNLTTMDFVSGGIGYVAGYNTNMDSTVVFKTIDSGSTWNKISAIKASGFASIDFYDANNGCINADFKILKTSNGGSSWSVTYNDVINYADINDLHFPVVDTGYAVDIFGGILKTVDGGMNWVALTNTITADPLYSVHFTDVQTGWAGGGNGLNSGPIIKTTNGGSTWILTSNGSQTLQSLHFPSPNIGYACGTNGTILKYNGLTGIFEEQNTFSINIYPNPAIGKFYLYEPGEVSVFNSLGETICHKNTTASNKEIDLSLQPKGIYFMKVQSEDGKVYTEKIVVQ